ncbi:glutamate--tRNA ligase, partial [Coemansia erecta]
LGTKHTVFSSQLFIDQADAATFEVGEELTLMDWGNAIVKQVERTPEGIVTNVQLSLHLQGDVKATKKKITWLGQSSEMHPVEALLVDYDYLITKKKLEEEDSVEDVLTPKTEFDDAAMVDANVARLPQGSIIQLERRGYYIVDKVAGQNELGLVTLIKIPDGKAASMASKHKDDGTTAQSSGKAVVGGGTKGNSWDKSNVSKKPKNNSSGVIANDASLGLPKPQEVADMYESAHVYGDVELDHHKDVTKMYQSEKFY